jgi:hypothetical protein
MGTSTKEAHQQVIAARKAFAGELDELTAATRSALDIPAKIRKHPVETAGIAGGAAFLAVGGPKRVLRAVARRARPTKKQRLQGILPPEVEKAVERLGAGAEDVRERIEQDFFDWMSKRRSKEAPANARQSFWKTYDAFLGPLGALGAKALAQRFFAAPKDRPAGSRQTGDEAADVTMADLAAAKAGERITEKLGGGTG